RRAAAGLLVRPADRDRGRGAGGGGAPGRAHSGRPGLRRARRRRAPAGDPRPRRSDQRAQPDPDGERDPLPHGRAVGGRRPGDRRAARRLAERAPVHQPGHRTAAGRGGPCGDGRAVHDDPGRPGGCGGAAALPAVAGADMAARFIPGHGAVGGDWYDAFTLPSGELCMVVGDVAGSGLPAAVVMGRMRSALRAYALETCDPAEVLARLDRKVQHFEPGALATVLYAVFDQALDRVHVSSAGHLPPALAAPGQPADLADIKSDLMIGVDPGVRRRVTTVKVMPGGSLCLYTDGLVERREYPLDDGLAR